MIKEENKSIDYSSLTFFKDFINQPGIYGIKNKKNDRIYIGKTKDLQRRFHYHFETLLYNNHPNELFQEDYNEYGINAFVFEVLEEISIQEQYKLTAQENFWINQFPSSLLYNKLTSFNPITTILQKSNLSESDGSDYFSLNLLDQQIKELGWKEGDTILHRLTRDKKGIKLEKLFT